MKNTMLIVVGVMGIMGFMGCQKKEVAAPIEEPIVTEETTATALANLETNAVNIAAPVVTENLTGNVVAEPVTSALEAVSGSVEQNVNEVIENPTPLQIQEALKNAGYYEGKIDGSIGPKTKKAIEKFQTENGLKADGKVGRKTWSKLGVHLAVNAASAGISSAASIVAPVTEPILTTENTEMPATNEVR
ncbi:MAG: peptidoglycan-binding protein [Candidatus Omnitrophica bacterium]|nr:peptidoglycan-binding protein [Candidatus Omnitrophota bacterium]